MVLASARPSPGLFKERDILCLQDFGGILMSYNGGRIVEAGSGKVLFQTAMKKEEARAVLRFLEQLPVTPILDDGVRFYVTDQNGYKVDYECKNNRMECTEVANLADFLSSSLKSLSLIESSLPELMKLRRTPTRMNGRTKVEWRMLHAIRPIMAEQIMLKVVTL